MFKPLQKLSILFVAVLWLGSSGKALGQIFSEDFDYSAGSELKGANGWRQTGTAASPTILVSPTGLSYPGSPASGVGNGALLNANGDDVNKALPVTYGSGKTVYASFLLNVAIARSGDYFLHLGANPIGSGFFGRVYVKSAGAGFQLGVSKATNASPLPAATYGEPVFDLNTTYLVVLKYSIVEGTGNDVAEIFVNPVLGGAEPSVPLAKAEITSAGEATTIGSVALRQGGATSGASVTVDGIRVSDAWADVTAAAQADITPPTLVSTTPANGAANVETITDLTLNFNEAVVAGTGNVVLTWNEGTMSKTLSASDAQLEGATVTFKNVELLPGTTYALRIDNAAFKDAAGNSYAGLTGNGVSFSTAAVATPVLTSSTEAIAFPFTALGKSSILSYELSGSNLAESTTVTVTGPFQISKTNANFSSASLTFTSAELATAQKVYVRFSPTQAGSVTGSITNTTAGAQSLAIPLSGVSADPYNQNFNDPAFLTNSGWTRFSVTGAQVWASTNFGRDCLTGCNAATPNKAVQINGFAGGVSVPNEDWLISPELDLTSFTNMAVLDFWTISAFAGDQLKLMYSTDFTGTGNPNAANWLEIPGVFPAANSNLWTLSQGIELPKTAKYVAFVYTTASGASRWTVDDVRIQDLSSFHTIPAATLSFGEAASGTTSAAQTFTFRAVGYGSVTLTASAGFELSADNGGTFASSVTLPETETAAAAGKAIQVRFAPVSRQLKVEGAVTFTSAGLNVSTIQLLGSSYLKAETFDIATYNMEFFGNGNQIGTGFGPANALLQIANATTVLNRMNMDIIGVEEISDETALDQVIANLPAGYAKRISPVYSYSIKPNSSTEPFPAQKIGFLYNTAHVTPVGFRVMFEDLYRQAVAGTTTLINDDFWSSGRLPYMGIFDVRAGGITKRIHVITIHAKSGSATSDFNRRVADIQVLKDTLDTYYANQNVILLGDFNDNVVGSINAGGVSSYNSFVTDVADYQALTYPLAQAGGFSFPSSGSFLDHLIISNELMDEYLEPSTTIEDPRGYVANYSNTTSDHLPVFSRFAFTSTDPVGTKEDEKDKFRIYPNPTTTGNVVLQLPVLAPKGVLQLTVYSLRGEIVLQTSGNEQTMNQQLSAKMSAANPGMYLVKIQAGDRVYQARLIKK
ncbi:Ig-like domain-containing protein [Rufibacter sediminis]|uniref:Ig-like domain-containing protein n=1 Tax=Rufibacter sediminis TaxID=2762756 RepID=A0ABR6VW28_9BACT|nr:Ig-like domain-containing protein [Rufibacter sediminis]MBC3541361.1 Ig-like domain-containing protein [Rufibacter sediminis]